MFHVAQLRKTAAGRPPTQVLHPDRYPLFVTAPSGTPKASEHYGGSFDEMMATEAPSCRVRRRSLLSLFLYL